MKKGHIFLICSTLIWGTSLLFTGLLVDDFSVAQIGVSRFGVAVIVMLVIIFFTKGSLKVEFLNGVKYLFSGVVGLFSYSFLETAALSYVPTFVVYLFIGIIPIITLMIELLLKRRVLTKYLFAIFALLLTAMYFMFIYEKDLTVNATGYLLCLGSIVSWIVFLFISENFKDNDQTVMTYQISGAFIAYLVVSIFQTGNVFVDFTSFPRIILVLYIGTFITAFAYLFFYKGLKHVGPGIASIYDNLVFVIGFVISIIIGKVVLTLVEFIACILMVIAVFLATKLERDKIND